MFSCWFQLWLHKKKKKIPKLSVLKNHFIVPHDFVSQGFKKRCLAGLASIHVVSVVVGRTGGSTSRMTVSPTCVGPGCSLTPLSPQGPLNMGWASHRMVVSE